MHARHLATTFVLLTLSWSGLRLQADEKPNILFIMADDLGWMDLACQGNRLVETPHIDRLASQGMRLTDAYAAAPVCSPTRAAVLTGLAPARIGLTTHLPGRFFPQDQRPQPAPLVSQLAARYVTIAERLREAGYANGFFGKWHLAPSAGPQGRVAEALSPLNQGFDRNIGGTAHGGPPSFFSPYRIATLPDGKPGEYLPDRLVNETIEFVRQHKDQPWMAQLWFYTVHWPMQAPQRLLEKYADRRGPGLNDTRYGAMIEAMDLGVGRLLAALDALQLQENTLVVFTSDNGGFAGVSDCRPLRESKGYLYEGGIRVPLLVRWPGRVAAGSTSATPVISMDFFPTFLEVAGLAPDPSQPRDGVSMLPLLLQTGQLHRPALYFHFPNYAWHMDNRLGSAIRSGNFKLLRNYDDGSLELYDLKNDLSEQHNLATQRPALADRLQRQLAQWLRQTGAPMPLPPQS